jgi:hypothetical protein
VLNKWFNKKKFIELGIDGYAMLSGNKTTVNPIPTGNSKDNQSGYSAAVNTGIGKGRLENITDMQNALWLAKTLQGVNRLRHRLTPEELDALGHTITTANNTRVLDARRRTQFILRTVDHYFQENHLIDTTDITYFSNLNDIVFFAFNTPRLSGTEKFIRFTPGMTGYDDKAWQNNYSDKRKEASTVRSLDLSIGISKYVPLSLKTQNNFGTALHFDYANINYANHYYTSGILTNETKDNADLRQAALNVFFEHAIYPNTRTQILFKLQSLGGYQELNKQTDWFVTANATAGWNYFISYSTRLQINLGGIYSKNAYEVDRYVSQLPDNIQLYGSVVLNIAI